MNLVEIIINDIKVSVPDNITILKACRDLDIDLPTLCHHPDQSVHGSCRLCVVEIEGNDKLQTACSTIVKSNMNVKTHSEKVMEERKILLELLLANHDHNCGECTRNSNCELQDVTKKIGMDENRFVSTSKLKEIDNSNPSLVRNPNKCIKCGRCVEVCRDIQGLDLLEDMGRSNDLYIGPEYGKFLTDIACTFCGQCSSVCPVGAITEKEEIDVVMAAINNPEKHVIVQVAPAVRVAIGECFGMEPGSIATGKLVASLKKIGFDKVFDTNFAADLTIIEESYELLHRVKNNGILPMITSCSPGWINYIEQYYPELLDHVSSCKSPQQMFGAIAKTYYSEKMGIDAKDIFVVSIMPCTAKKFEAKRDEMKLDTINPDVDAVLTTRELAKVIKEQEIDFNNLEDSEFDIPFGISTGAGAIFGNTGGVMEAALRTFYELTTQETLPDVNFTTVRGLKGMKEATVNISGKEIKVAVVHTLVNAKEILEQIKNNKSEYTFIEVMCCPGGCIGGGGQPYKTTNEIKQKRIDAIYEIDEKATKRKSHENPALQTLYKEFLLKPYGDKAQDLLHTKYFNRQKN